MLTRELGPVSIRSFDTPGFTRKWERRVVSVPSDATSLKFSEKGKEWVCKKKRDDPPDKKKKKFLMILDPSAIQEEVPALVPKWTPIPAASVAQGWEEAGRFVPVEGLPFLKLGLGFPLELYGVQMSVGFMRPWISWEAGEAAT